jgi:hypothetical protein
MMEEDQVYHVKRHECFWLGLWWKKWNGFFSNFVTDFLKVKPTIVLPCASFGSEIKRETFLFGFHSLGSNVSLPRCLPHGLAAYMGTNRIC